MKNEEYIGMKFGKLTINKYLHHTEYGQRIFECTCDCGNVGMFNIYNIKHKNKNPASCGCWISDITDHWSTQYKRFLADAKKRNHLVSITKQEFIKLCESNCNYCGSEPSLKMINRSCKYKRNGIDRVDNHIGYEQSNCVSCCWICNFAKRTLTIDEFKEWINKLILHNKSSSRIK